MRVRTTRSGASRGERETTPGGTKVPPEAHLAIEIRVAAGPICRASGSTSRLRIGARAAESGRADLEPGDALLRESRRRSTDRDEQHRRGQHRRGSLPGEHCIDARHRERRSVPGDRRSGGVLRRHELRDPWRPDADRRHADRSDTGATGVDDGELQPGRARVRPARRRRPERRFPGRGLRARLRQQRDDRRFGNDPACRNRAQYRDLLGLCADGRRRRAKRRLQPGSSRAVRRGGQLPGPAGLGGQRERCEARRSDAARVRDADRHRRRRRDDRTRRRRYGIARDGSRQRRHQPVPVRHRERRNRDRQRWHPVRVRPRRVSLPGGPGRRLSTARDATRGLCGAVRRSRG